MKYLKEFNIFDDIPEEVKHAEVVYEYDAVIIRRINTFNGSIKHGSSFWDISIPSGEMYWKEYVEDSNVTLYIIEDHNMGLYDARHLIAVLVDNGTNEVETAIFRDNEDAMSYVGFQIYFPKFKDFKDFKDF